MSYNIISSSIPKKTNPMPSHIQTTIETVEVPIGRTHQVVQGAILTLGLMPVMQPKLYDPIGYSPPERMYILCCQVVLGPIFHLCAVTSSGLRNGRDLHQKDFPWMLEWRFRFFTIQHQFH